ncbi:hypothetical protein FNF29_08230 [Cafeteria roenbergensis]|uniref:Uncharacterized protein n=1 Tax=Cafeteria roenbergensis TaxID=33653 RepID=A0A5A8C1W8_CAFRO|nr:hypothetical protein FNF28_07856 [Cafeteria roenbergensis]KAA0146128.1 hypothetical protein FNF29_08230 [Cafeteria roenbergensis]KAA0147072.1 hypothetical protein FNF31_07647 [Cafeteria roenbergensis]|eukprot:KAA0146128.1 hypothetical protein FNF29_08230 [Cafeteria roenbergensis]
MVLGPSNGWFSPDFVAFGGATAWIVRIPSIDIPNPVGQILFTQCNGSLALPAGHGNLLGTGEETSPDDLVQVAGQCVGDAAAQRVALATTVYFVTMAIASLAGPEVNRGLWAWKVLGQGLLMVGAFFLPADSGAPWAEAARVLAALFLLAEVFVMLDFAFVAHDCLAERMARRWEEIEDEYMGSDDKPGCCANLWQVAYALLSAVLWTGSAATVIAFAAKEANSGPACSAGTGALLASLLLAICYTIASLLECLAPASGAKGILPPSLVFAYCTWLLVSALSGLPDVACNPIDAIGDGQSAGEVSVSIAVATISVVYMALSASAAVPGLWGSAGAAAGEAQAERSLLEDNESEDGASPKEYDPLAVKDSPGAGHAVAPRLSADEEASPRAPERPVGGGSCSDARDMAWLFHIVMAVAAGYMGAVMTGWQVPASGQFELAANATVAGGSAMQASQRSVVAFAAQVGAAGFAVLLYTWCLIAELCCPGRSFGK